MKDYIQYIVTIVVAALTYLLGRGKQKADTGKTETETQNMVAEGYKEAAQYWKTMYDESNIQNKNLIKLQLEEQSNRERDQQQIKQLERKVEELSLQIARLSLKINNHNNY